MKTNYIKCENTFQIKLRVDFVQDRNSLNLSLKGVLLLIDDGYRVFFDTNGSEISFYFQTVFFTLYLWLREESRTNRKTLKDLCFTEHSSKIPLCNRWRSERKCHDETLFDKNDPCFLEIWKTSTFSF